MCQISIVEVIRNSIRVGVRTGVDDYVTFARLYLSILRANPPKPANSRGSSPSSQYVSPYPRHHISSIEVLWERESALHTSTFHGFRQGTFQITLELIIWYLTTL